MHSHFTILARAMQIIQTKANILDSTSLLTLPLLKQRFSTHRFRMVPYTSATSFLQYGCAFAVSTTQASPRKSNSSRLFSISERQNMVFSLSVSHQPLQFHSDAHVQLICYPSVCDRKGTNKSNCGSQSVPFHLLPYVENKVPNSSIFSSCDTLLQKSQCTSRTVSDCALYQNRE